MTAATVKSFNFDQLDRGTRFITLKTAIDEHETSALAVEAAGANKKIETLEHERSNINAEIKELRSTRDKALTAIGTGFREKDVQCEVGYDWKQGKKYTRRLDTKELVNSDGEPIGDDERQLQLEGLGAADILKKQEEDETPADEEESEFDGSWNAGDHEEDELELENGPEGFPIDEPPVEDDLEAVRAQERGVTGESCTGCGVKLTSKLDKEFNACSKCRKAQTQTLREQNGTAPPKGAEA